jgi:hypothetical protein
MEADVIMKLNGESIRIESDQVMEDISEHDYE